MSFGLARQLDVYAVHTAFGSQFCRLLVTFAVIAASVDAQVPTPSQSRTRVEDDHRIIIDSDGVSAANEDITGQLRAMFEHIGLPCSVSDHSPVSHASSPEKQLT